MSKARVVVSKSPAVICQSARQPGSMGSRQHIYRLLKRYHQQGLPGVDPRSRRPASNPRAVTDEVIAALVRLREELSAQGLDAGPLTLQWHLGQRGLAAPSTSTFAGSCTTTA